MACAGHTARRGLAVSGEDRMPKRSHASGTRRRVAASEAHGHLRPGTPVGGGCECLGGADLVTRGRNVQSASHVASASIDVVTDRRDAIDRAERVGLRRELLGDQPTRDVVARRRVDRRRLGPSQPRVVATQARRGDEHPAVGVELHQPDPDVGQPAQRRRT